jgi:CheY-like chemotaxis protein
MTGSPSENGVAASARALVVDDTPDIRFMVGFQLKMEGLSFEEASSGEEALARCEEEAFDLVVLDYRMPGLSGLDVARRLQSADYPAPLVIYSAYADDELQAAARSLDIPVVDKADNEQLLATVRDILASIK